MGTQPKRIFLVILNIAGLIATITINALANILPINGKMTGQLSDMYPNLFVPAGITFAIWGIIYILLVAFVAYQIFILIKKKSDTRTAIEKTGVFFFVTCCANSGWIFAWHYQIIPLSMALMVVLLATLIVMYVRLGIGRSNAKAGERYTMHIATSVYLGWISIATIANMSALLFDMHWNGFGIPEQVWTIAVILVGIGLALATLFSRKDIFYPLVVDWALLGILIKRMSIDPNAVMGIIVTAIAGMALITLCIAVQSIRRKVY
jgi:hypothetical protein